MLRRLTALLLALACVFTLALPAHETETAADDCCGTGPKSSCCCPRDCAPPPASPSRTAPTAIAAVETRAATAKPAARLLFVRAFALFSTENLVTLPRALPRAAAVPAASVPLFEAHCSLLI